jgi:hypothetical protein
LHLPGAGPVGERLLQPIFDRQLEEMLTALRRHLGEPE